MALHEMYFVNHNGLTIRFDGDGFRIKDYDLRDFRWEATLANKPSGIGGRVTRFARPAQTKKMTIVAIGKSPAQCRAMLNNMHAVTESDINAMRPGRFYLDGQYTTCFLAVSSVLNDWKNSRHYAEKTIDMTCTYPFWITEELRRFHAGGAESSEHSKRYNGRYAYQYGTGYANSTLNNTHYMATPMVLSFYGPCVNPSVYIGGNHYGVESSAGEGERIVIDQLARTIFKIGVTGATINLFDYRYKDADQFLPIPVGVSQVSFNGSFDFDALLLKQRSEPEWI